MPNMERISQRVRNMAIYFVENTLRVNKRKLEKLFYLADLMAYEKTAFTISGQSYIAREKGPSPRVGQKSLLEHFKLTEEVLSKKPEDGYFTLKPGMRFDKSMFYPPELEVLKTICTNYRDMDGDALSDITHAKGGPWREVWQNSAGKDKPIDFSTVDRALCAEKRQARDALREVMRVQDEAFAELQEHA